MVEALDCLALPAVTDPEAVRIALGILDTELGRVIDLRQRLDVKAAGVPLAVAALGGLVVPHLTLASPYEAASLFTVLLAGSAAFLAVLFSVIVLNTGLLLVGPRLEVAASTNLPVVEYRRALAGELAAAILAGLDDAATRMVRLNLAVAALGVVIASMILLALLGGIR